MGTRGTVVMLEIAKIFSSCVQDKMDGSRIGMAYRLRSRDCLAACLSAHAGEGPEGVIC